MRIVKALDNEAKKQTRTTVDTLLFTPDQVKEWKNPPFQRPLRINDKVNHLAVTIKADGGVVPGVLTLGILNRETYLLDGQHRIQAFILSGCDEGAADVRKHFFDSMGEMGEEFVNLNSSLVNLRPDDIMRGLEGVNEGLQIIRKKCPFVGYDMIRRNERSPILSMSTVLRCWFGAMPEVPGSGGASATQRANTLTNDEADHCSTFLTIIMAAWGRDPEYVRLWNSLNLTLTMWMYRRTVLSQYSQKSFRLTREQFQKCAMRLSANANYLDWLTARSLNDRNRSPSYARIKQMFAACIEQETGRKPMLPQPAWSGHQ
jgi:hypothetical protein